MVKASITKVQKDFYDAFVRAVHDLGGYRVSRGNRVLIKPNLVEPAAPDSREITNPRLVEAAARYCLEAGASRVIIGEGPSYYQPESRLRECFTRTGISGVADRLGIKWVLFDEHRYRTFKGISGTPEEFRVTEFAFTCDQFINLPVLKTHYLTKVTLAMKNLKGCLKREDKARFHRHDLERAVVHLAGLIRPTLNVIDCPAGVVKRQMASGCVPDRNPVGSGMLIASTDMVAADTLGSSLMGIDPQKVRTITLGAAAGLGESDLSRMDIVGEELKGLRFKIKLPQEMLRENFPLLEIVGTEKACSGCLIPLLSALSNLHEQGVKLKNPLAICIGQEPNIPQDRPGLFLGDCAGSEGRDGFNNMRGCPPKREDLLEILARLANDGRRVKARMTK